MKTFKLEDFENRYSALTASVRCQCVFATELVGGQPAGRDAIRAFATHHLGITDPQEVENAASRILKEEVGEKDIRPAEGELEEKQVYGVNVIRRTEHGPWLGDWMIKACIKQAASRLKIFQDIRGTKGDFSESGRVRAVGASLVESDHPERVYIRNSRDTGPAETYFQEFMGRVQSAKGPTSIIHHSECVPPGSVFEFEYRFMLGTLNEEDLRDVLAMAMIMGLGSAKALERGKFRILEAVINGPAERRVKPGKVVTVRAASRGLASPGANVNGAAII